MQKKRAILERLFSTIDTNHKCSMAIQTRRNIKRTSNHTYLAEIIRTCYTPNSQSNLAGFTTIRRHWPCSRIS